MTELQGIDSRFLDDYQLAFDMPVWKRGKSSIGIGGQFFKEVFLLIDWPSKKIGTRGASFSCSWNKTWSETDNFKHEFGVGLQLQHALQDGFALLDDRAFYSFYLPDNRVNNLGLGLNWKIELFQENHLNMGFSVNNLFANEALSGLEEHQNYSGLQVYLMSNLRLSEKWRILPRMRFVQTLISDSAQAGVNFRTFFHTDKKSGLEFGFGLFAEERNLHLVGFSGNLGFVSKHFDIMLAVYSTDTFNRLVATFRPTFSLSTQFFFGKTPEKT